MKEGWEIKKLGEVCGFENGDRGVNYPSKKDFQESGIPFVNAGHINDGMLLIKKLNYISFDKYNSLSREKIKNGDLVFCLRGSLGKFAHINFDFKGAIASSLVIVRPNADLQEEFLSMYFRSSICKKMITDFAGGAAQPNLGAKDLKKFQIPIPPLPEQKRIVAILDRAFKAIDQAKAYAKQNLKNAKELFESYLNRVFEEKGNDWVEKNLGEIGKVSMCKRILKKQTSSTGDIPFYKIGTFGKTANAFIPKETYDNYKSKYSFPKKGDILLSASGTIGRRVVYNGKSAYFQDSNIVWIDNDEKNVLNEYLFHFYGYCDWNPSKGATISRLYNDDLRRIIISFPNSIETQKQIVQQLDALQTETRKLEAIYQQKIVNLEELKKSFLEKAFNGEL